MHDLVSPLSGELLKLKVEIEAYAKDYGLDFYPVVFEVCDYDTINILASLGGFPSRYPHWRFGMDYDQLSKGYAYGLQKIYEMVINTDPCYAYLLKGNHMVDQKMVMAHVFGHADFFKNNAWFSNTDRKMMDVMANHGTKIRRYMGVNGQDKIEAFIDKVLSLENLLDINVLFETSEVKKQRENTEKRAKEEDLVDDDGRSQALKSYMRTKNKHDKSNQAEAKPGDADRFEIKKYPERPVRDILQFLAENAPLEEWESDIISILREEAYYFLPQRLTKIMNEGWASYWHSTIMTKHALKASEIIDFADHHAGVMAMSKKNINPYKVGIELFRDIEYRWDTGRFGKNYIDCDNMVKKYEWNKDLGLGKEKIFEVRATHNDITFLDEFFTQDFCERQQLFTYKYNPRSGRFEIDTRDFLAIKQKFLSSLTNFGQPVIDVDDANFNNRGELHMTHRHQGVDLDANFAEQTMKNIFAIWKRPINLTTKYDDKECTFCFNGKEFKPLK
ncbi:MAG: SpoVR family protein [Bacteriovoracaceae bacterium]|nr:SpoVR family protein [Bacteriovoracaceae bacterium]